MFIKRCFALFILIFSLACIQTKQDSFFNLDVHEITLNNGMRFLILPRQGAPVFTGYVRVLVGGYDETPEKTGIAHMLEHMAFKGTREIGTRNFVEEQKQIVALEKIVGELASAQGATREALLKEFENTQKQASQYVIQEDFSKIYSRNGGADLNANTSQDLTTYLVSLPSNKLELWAMLEAQRFINPVFREFYMERDVVMEERRMRVEDSPFGSAYEEFMQMAFAKSPYRNPTIGYGKDIQNLTATDMQTFFESHYSPENMVGAVVGNIDVQEAEKVIRQYFEKIPQRKLAAKPDFVEPAVKPQQRVITKKSNPIVMIGFQKPTIPNNDDFAFDLLDGVLCSGLTSRLQQRLMLKDKIANQLECNSSTPGTRSQNLYFIYATLLPGKNSDQFLKALYEELDKIAAGDLQEEEIKRSRKNLLANTFFSLEENEELANLLSYYEIITGDWHYLSEHPKKISTMGINDLQRIVKKYLTPDRAVVLVVNKQ